MFWAFPAQAMLDKKLEYNKAKKLEYNKQFDP